MLDEQLLEDLLVAWLNELVYVVWTMRWAPARVRVLSAGTDGLRARLEGAPLGPAKLALEIKAATYGALVVRKESGGLKTTIILDV